MLTFYRVVTLLVLIIAPLSSLRANDAPVNFLVFGDFGTGTTSQTTVAATMRRYCTTATCDFVLGMGDNFYPKGVKSVDDPKWKTHFMDPYGPLNLIFYASLGNHDYAGDVQAQVAYSKKNSLWFMPNRYYRFEKEGATFYALDTNEFTSAQQTWLSNQLDQAKTGWRIAYGHHPIYSYGEHGDTEELIDDLLPKLRKRADFYFCGHEHDKQVLTAEDGLILMVSGAAAQTRPTKSGARTLYASSTLGFAHVTLDSDLATLRFIDKDGKVEYQRSFPQAAR